MGKNFEVVLFHAVRSPSVRLSERNSSRRDEQALPKSLITPRLPHVTLAVKKGQLPEITVAQALSRGGNC